MRFFTRHLPQLPHHSLSLSPLTMSDDSLSLCCRKAQLPYREHSACFGPESASGCCGEHRGSS